MLSWSTASGCADAGQGVAAPAGEVHGVERDVARSSAGDGCDGLRSIRHTRHIGRPRT